jgi:hypothetical protein
MRKICSPAMVLFVACLMLVVAPLWAAGEADKKKDDPNHDSLAKALTEGKFSVSLRYRYETVDDETPTVAANNGDASTLRSTLAYKSGKWANLRLFAEFQDVTDIGYEDKHNNAGRAGLSNGVGDRPVVADPDNTMVNQAYLQYTGVEKTAFTLGRQEVNLQDHRFVGNVGWRQNHQSFDALRATTKAIPRTALTYVYIDQVNRIFGDHQMMDGHLLDAKIKVAENWGHVMPYYYRLDYDAMANFGLSTNTFGLAWAGACKPGDGDWTVPWRLEFAQQDDTGDNPNEVDAAYHRVEVGGQHLWYWIKVGYELQEGSLSDGRFRTPLATLHKFNGWADKFLVTPPNGLEDTWIGFGGKSGPFSGGIYWHDFASDSMSMDYGDEIDAVFSYKAPWKQTFALKYASYNADELGFDTDKIWFFTTYAFGQK